jgi:hypothetical protein
MAKLIQHHHSDSRRNETPIDRLLRNLQAEKVKNDGYKLACTLDTAGEYEKADQVLLKAGVSASVVEKRRAHINWRISQHLPAIDGR